jgi:ectoine hydroxylase-related dioxygenase (phytanoyl-CoA dioxygenase family)
MSVTTEWSTDQLPVPTHDLATAKRDLDEWGYCLLADALSPTDLARVRARVIEQAAAEVGTGVARFDTGKHPSKHEGTGVNQRVNSLVNKGSVFHEVALHPDVSTLLEHTLGPRFLMTSFTANITAPGCELQDLHIDQGYVTRPLPLYAITTNVVWMLDDVDDVNGGTRVVPKSHLWDHDLESQDTPTAGAVAPAGTAMVVEGRTWHQAGANRSDRRRHVLLANYCRAWVRQQENPFLATAPDVEASLSPAMRRLLGWKTWGTLGHIGEPGTTDEQGYVHRPEHYTTQLP